MHRDSDLSLDGIATRRAEEQERYEKRREAAAHENFMRELKIHSLLTPSLEFIPKFPDFIALMYKGLDTGHTL